MARYSEPTWLALEMEVKGLARLNKLSNPVPNTNTFTYNQTPNPSLAQTKEPYNSSTASYSVKEYPIVAPGWESNGNVSRLYFWRTVSATSGANALIAESEAMAARPGERWSAQFEARHFDNLYYGQQGPSTWLVSLGAYNGNTFISDVAQVQFRVGSGYAQYTTTHVSLTPANTTNVKWRMVNVTTESYASLDMFRFAAFRKFESQPGWTNTSSKLQPVYATWGYGPTVFESYDVTGTAYHTSNSVPMTVGQWAGAAFDFVNGTGQVRLRFLDAAGAQYGTASSSPVNASTNKQRVMVRAQCPSGATRVVMDVIPTNGMRWDAAVMVTDGAAIDQVQQLGFKETSGFAVTNKLLNSLGTTSANGWTPQGSAGLLTPTAEGLQFSINSDSANDYRTANIVHAMSNIMECNPGNWISFQTRVKGNGYVRFRYQWLTALDQHISYSEYSGGQYFGNSNLWFAGTSIPSGGIAYGETLQVPANAFRVRVHIHYEHSVGMETGPFFPDSTNPFSLTFTDARFLVGETMGGVTGVPNSETITWLQMFNNGTEIMIDREPMEPGVMTATIKDATVDPSKNVSVRPDARVRLRYNQWGVWRNLFQGTLDDIDVTYTYDKVKKSDVTMVKLRVIDNAKQLFTERDTYGGVATINALNSVMSGSDVPWILEADDSATATKVNMLDDVSKGDQVILTRDTARGYAFINKDNTLVVRGNNRVVPAVANQLTFTNQNHGGNNQTYVAELDVAMSADDVINSVQVKQLTIGTGSEGEPATIETTYAAVTNGESINEWGLRNATVTINGGVNATTWANALLAAHASPSPQVSGVSFPVNDWDSYRHATDVELCDIVNVVYSPAGLNKQYRINRIVQRITPQSWMCELEFKGVGLSATFGGKVEGGQIPPRNSTSPVATEAYVDGKITTVNNNITTAINNNNTLKKLSGDGGTQELVFADSYWSKVESFNYRVLNNVCYFSIGVSRGGNAMWAANRLITTLPVGARPVSTVWFVGNWGGVANELKVLSNGQIVVGTAATAGGIVCSGSFPVA